MVIQNTGNKEFNNTKLFEKDNYCHQHQGPMIQW